MLGNSWVSCAYRGCVRGCGKGIFYMNCSTHWVAFSAGGLSGAFRLLLPLGLFEQRTAHFACSAAVQTAVGCVRACDQRCCKRQRDTGSSQCSYTTQRRKTIPLAATAPCAPHCLLLLERIGVVALVILSDKKQSAYDHIGRKISRLYFGILYQTWLRAQMIFFSFG